MEKIIKTIVTQLLSNLKKDRIYYTQKDLSDFGYPQFLIKRIIFHLVREINSEFKLPGDEWLNRDSDELLAEWAELQRTIKREIQLPVRLADKIVEKSIRECIDMTIQPRKVIPLLLFEDRIELDVHQLTESASAITVNRFLVWSMVRYMEKKNRSSLSIPQATRIIELIDDKIVQGYHPLNWLSLVKPLYELSGSTVHSDLFRRFFEHKGKNHLAKEFDLIDDEIKESRFIEILSSPNSIHVKGYKDDQQTLFQEEHEGNEFAESTEGLEENRDGVIDEEEITPIFQSFRNDPVLESEKWEEEDAEGSLLESEEEKIEEQASETEEEFAEGKIFETDEEVVEEQIPEVEEEVGEDQISESEEVGAEELIPDEDEVVTDEQLMEPKAAERMISEAVEAVIEEQFSEAKEEFAEGKIFETDEEVVEDQIPEVVEEVEEDQISEAEEVGEEEKIFEAAEDVADHQISEAEEEVIEEQITEAEEVVKDEQLLEPESEDAVEKISELEEEVADEKLSVSEDDIEEGVPDEELRAPWEDEEEGSYTFITHDDNDDSPITELKDLYNAEQEGIDDEDEHEEVNDEKNESSGIEVTASDATLLEINDDESDSEFDEDALYSRFKMIQDQNESIPESDEDVVESLESTMESENLNLVEDPEPDDDSDKEDSSLLNRFMFDDADDDDTLANMESDGDKKVTTIYDELNLVRNNIEPETMDLFGSFDEPDADEITSTKESVEMSSDLDTEESETIRKFSDIEESESENDSNDSEVPMWRSFLERDENDVKSAFQFDDESVASVESDVDESDEKLDEDGFIEEPIYDFTKKEVDLDEKIGDLSNWMKDVRDKFIEDLFGDSEDAYEQALSDIMEFEDWKNASKYIEKEIFTRNRIDIYDEIAVDFTDRLHSYFIENKS